MNLPVPNIDLRALVKAIGEPLTSIEPLASGATSEVWKIVTPKRSYVLRLFSRQPNRIGLQTEIHLRNSMAARSAAIAEPILSSSDLPDVGPEAGWMLDLFVPGTHGA